VQVIATAGHVDHGKSALVRALTGMEPDRWAEERRRGMTIDLGYAWTALPSGTEIAFVDVPGHERFTTNMLAGVGPVPAVLVVVAADGGWSAQTTEHVAAIDALGVTHGVLAVTRSDLADPGPALADAHARLAETSLGDVEAVAVSVVDGRGLPELRGALDRLTARLAVPDPAAPVRLWVDRAFVVTGFGTVLTGTLGAGRIAPGDTLELDGEAVSVRGLEQLGSAVPSAEGVARVAVNLRGQRRDGVRRGQALLSPGSWLRSRCVDVRISSDLDRLPRQLVVHIGSAAVPADVRRLGARHARLDLAEALPLRVGDRALLRDPGLRRILSGVTVIDPAPPPLAARGAARARTVVLDTASGRPDATEEVARREIVSRRLLVQLGADPGAVPGAVEHAGWVIGAGRWARWQADLADLAGAAVERAERLVTAGITEAAAAYALGLPDPELLGELVRSRPDLERRDGQIVVAGTGRSLAAPVAGALAPLLERLAAAPFDAPPAEALRTAGLGARELAAAAASGAVLLLPGDVILRPDAPAAATAVLAGLASPFTLSSARQALGTSRRVAVPLLEHLDRAGVTRRLADSRRVMTGRRPAPG
jgi:selenocysteine-specific elongation factor